MSAAPLKLSLLERKVLSFLRARVYAASVGDGSTLTIELRRPRDGQRSVPWSIWWDSLDAAEYDERHKR